MGTYIDAVEEIQDEQNNKTNEEVFKIATVTSLSEDKGCAKVTFVGEDIESSKEYSYIYSYKPTVNDIVLLAKTKSTYIIIGKIATNIQPDEGVTDEHIRELADEQIIDDTSLVRLSSQGAIHNTQTSVYNQLYKIYSKDIDSLLVYADTLKTSSSGKVGFFGSTAVSKQSVSSLSSSTTDISTVVTKLNSVISALDAYGLL